MTDCIPCRKKAPAMTISGPSLKQLPQPSAWLMKAYLGGTDRVARTWVLFDQATVTAVSGGPERVTAEPLYTAAQAKLL